MLNTPTATRFLDKVRSERAAQVFLVQGTQKGKPVWIYALVGKTHLKIFEHKLSQPGMDVSQYGEILYSGWGIEPPTSVKNQVKKDFMQ